MGVVAAGTGLLAFGMAILQSGLRKNYDPNAMPLADRLDIARSRCLADIESRVPVRGSEDNSLAGHVDSQNEPKVDDKGSVSSADKAAGAQFVLYGMICQVLGLILLGRLPEDQQWRALAACALGGVFFLFAAKFSMRKT